MDCKINDMVTSDSLKQTLDKVQEYVSGMSEVDQMENKLYPDNVTAAILNNKGFKVNDRPVEITKVRKVNNRTVVEYKNGNGFARVLDEDKLSIDEGNIDTDYITQLHDNSRVLIENGETFETIAVDMINNPAKIVELAEELDVNDSTSVSQADRDLVKAGLKSVVAELRRAMPKINMHLNKYASKNDGFIELSNNHEDVSDVFLKQGTEGSQSMVEVLSHELHHAATNYALKSRDPKLAGTIRSIIELRDGFVKNVDKAKWKELLNHPNADQIIEDTLDYMTGPNGIREFVTYSRSNPAVMRLQMTMKTKREEIEHPNYFSKMVHLVKKMFDRMFAALNKEPESTSDYTRMAWLTMQLMDANNKALEIKKNNRLTRFMEVVNGAEQFASGWIDKQKDKVSSKNIRLYKGKSNLGLMLWVAKLLGRSLVDEKAKRVVEWQLSNLKMRPEGTLQTIARDMQQSDDYQDNMELLGAHSGQIEQNREMVFANTASTIRKAFSGKIDDFQMKALENLTRADVIALAERDDLDKLFDYKYLESQITAAEKELESLHGKGNMYYYRMQAESLANYMMTGDAHAGMLQNARNIADRINSDRIDADERTVQLVDELTSMYAMKHVGKTGLDAIKSVISKERNGVMVLFNYLVSNREDAKQNLFAGEERSMIKGYVRDVYKSDFETINAPVSEQEKLKKEGFKLVKTHKIDGLTSNTVEMGFYVSVMPVRQKWLKGTARITHDHRRGETFRDMFNSQNSAVGKEKAELATTRVGIAVDKWIAEVKKGNKTIPSELMHMMPLTTVDGGISDYRFVMNLRDKTKHLGLDRNIIKAVARTKATIEDKKATPEHNIKVADLLISDLENRRTKDGLLPKEYVLIGANSNNPEHKEMWRILPPEFKEYIESRTGEKGIHVRRDMLNMVMGFRERSYIDTELGKRLNVASKTMIRQAEIIWKEVVKYVKGTILLKIPAVLLGNIYSNIMYLLMSGISPITVTKYQLQAVKELNEYVKNYKEIKRLAVLVQVGKATKEEQRRLSAMMDAAEHSPIKDLVDAGFWTQIIEGEDTTHEMGYLAKKIDDQYAKWPGVVQNGYDWVFMTDKNPVYQFMSTATQYSDFVARYVQYHVNVGSGMSSKEAIIKARNSFVNYQKPNSPLVEYLNQMGLVMFTKYFTRIQRVITTLFKESPIKAITILLGEQYVVGSDLPLVTDASWVVNSIFNKMYNPIQEIGILLQPHGFNYARDVLT